MSRPSSWNAPAQLTAVQPAAASNRPARVRPRIQSRSRPLAAALIGLALLGAAAGCTRPDAGAVTRADQAFDPYEATNRKVHAFNKGVDRAVLRPVSTVYATVVPEPFNVLVGNFADNLGTPSDVVNNLLQARFEDAAVNAVRFVMNTTLGVGGLVDAATAFGIAPRDTDFGETLAIWGVPEGAYQELPLLGPSTERDTAGRVVDLFTNPLNAVLDPSEQRLKTGARVASSVGDRGYRKGTVDSLLYDSADSYAQLRLMYLQNRRYQLGSGADDAYLDPYDDQAAESGGDYIDPYIDPYAE